MHLGEVLNGLETMHGLKKNGFIKVPAYISKIRYSNKLAQISKEPFLDKTTKQELLYQIFTGPRNDRAVLPNPDRSHTRT